MKWLIFLTVQCVLYINHVLPSSVSHFNHGEVELFKTPVSYDVETTVFLNEITKKDKEIGYKIKAKLNVNSVWADPGSEFLLKLQLLRPQLYLRGKHPNANFMVHNSVWDDYSDTTFYAHWKSGVIQNSYLDLHEIPDIVNYKKSLISLFQFQIIDGEFNETDFTGSCDVIYESLSEQTFRKVKRRCAGDERLEGGRARRLTRYTLDGGALAGLYADELVELGDEDAGVKARSWHQLRRGAGPAPAAPSSPSSPAALGAALAALPAPLAPCDLRALPAADADDADDTAVTADDDQALEAAVDEALPALEAEEAGRGGTAAQAAAVLRLLPALRAAPAARLRRLLQRGAGPPPAALCRLLGLAGAAAAHEAADRVLHLAAPDALRPAADHYLAALALAPEPEPAVAAAAARLAERARHPAVARAALLAAAAATARLPGPDAAAAGLRLRDEFVRALARCKEDACRADRARALGLLRRDDAAGPLLALAERGGRAGLAALDALEALGAGRWARVLPRERRARLERLALAGRPPELRAAALDLLLRASAALPAPLADTARALDAAPRELRRLFWERLAQLAAEPAHAELRALARELPAALGWERLAAGGASAVLARDTGWAAGGARARLHAVLAAAGGLLRRGVVRLEAGGAELLAVRVWTAGLHALAGAAPADGVAADEEPAAGLELAAGGAPLADAELFRGRAELLARVWAGAGSAPTPVLRALAAGGARAAAVPLAGGARARLARRAAAAGALDAQAQVSLWARTARARLRLRAGGAARATARVRTAWADLRATAGARLEPRLRLAADLDFYDSAAAALCVRAHLPAHTLRRESRLESKQGARGLRVTRTRTWARTVPGRTLSLGRRNDAACRTLAASPQDDDDDEDDGDGDGDA